MTDKVPQTRQRPKSARAILWDEFSYFRYKLFFIGFFSSIATEEDCHLAQIDTKGEDKK